MSRIRAAIAAMPRALVWAVVWAWSKFPTLETTMLVLGVASITAGLVGYDWRIGALGFGLMCLLPLVLRRLPQRSKS